MNGFQLNFWNSLQNNTKNNRSDFGEEPEEIPEYLEQ